MKDGRRLMMGRLREIIRIDWCGCASLSSFVPFFTMLPSYSSHSNIIG